MATGSGHGGAEKMNFAMPVTGRRRDRRLAAFGLWLKRHRRAVRLTQWGVVAIYAALLIVPALIPLPDRAAHIWNNVTLFAQFVFWGVWWPGVLLSMLLFGRLWCGLFCPEGALSAFAARHGRGQAVPGWIRWPGWPFAAFVATTVYGQLISVYQYPMAALLILGGSTVAAMLVGYFYGRDKRVWCRYLCPVSGVFGLLSKLAPMHYAVDAARWRACPSQIARQQAFNCEPLVPVRTMESASLCHMCGRCAGFRGAVALRPRLPNSEIVGVSGRTATLQDSLLLVTGLIGVVIGAFQWSVSPWFVTLKLALATYLIDAGTVWPLQTSLPWWLLTNYPENNDVLSVVDAATMLAYIFTAALTLTVAIGLPLALATVTGGGWTARRFHHLAQALIPIAGGGVILGLSSQTVTLLRAEGLDLNWLPWLRAFVLGGAGLWSLRLAFGILRTWGGGAMRGYLAAAAFFPAALAPIVAWIQIFWIW